MKKMFSHIKEKLLAGLVFLIPLFALALLIQKLWTLLNGSGNYLANMLGLKPVLGSTAAPVVTSLLLALLIYLFGWLVKIRAMDRSKEWIETRLLQYIPGYLTYKAQLTEKLGPKKVDKRVPVWVTINDYKRPGLIIEEGTDEAIVFFPNSPDSNNGEIVKVTKGQLSKLEMTASSFFKSLQNFGKDMLNNIQTVEKKALA